MNSQEINTQITDIFYKYLIQIKIYFNFTEVLIIVIKSILHHQVTWKNKVFKYRYHESRSKNKTTLTDEQQRDN